MLGEIRHNTDGYNVTVLDLDIDNLNELSAMYNKTLFLVCAVHNVCRCTFECMENTNEETYRELVEQGCFKTVRIGSAIRISKKSFDEWLEEQLDEA